MTNRNGVPERSSISWRNGTAITFHFTNRNAVPVRSGSFRALYGAEDADRTFCHIGFHIILLVNRNVRGSSLGKGRNLVRDLSSTCAPIANSAMMSKLTAHCQWVDETVWVRTGHPPSYAEAKKIKSLTLYTQGCLRASLRDWSSSS